jgi:hypothetical protein
LEIVGQGEQRNPAFFINLSPGVTSRGTSTPTASGSGRQLNTTVNGSPSGSTEFHLDGVQIGNPGLLSGDFRNLPFPQDAVAEFKILTVNPPAEYGRAGLGITAFTLRSGTNQIHGSVYEYLRNDKLDARGFFAPTTPLNKQNEFGATAGGPVFKDRTFFYGWYQGFRRRQQVSNSLDTVPTAAMRGGNLSNVLGAQIGTDALGRPVFASQIFDPATTRTVAAGAVDPMTGLTNTSGSAAIIRDGFGFNPVTGLPTAQANVIPSGRIDPVARAMFAQFPNPTLPGQAFGYQNNWLSQFKAQSSVNQWGSKIDHSLSSSNKMMGEFLWLRNHAPTGSKWPGAISEGATNDSGQYVVRFSHDWIFRPNLINHWVVGYNRWRNDSFPEGGIGWPAQLGFKGVPQDGAGSTFPQLIIGGLGNVYARGNQGYSATNNYMFDDGLSWIKGKHTFKTGFSYIKFQENGGNFGGQSSKLNFSAGYTALPLPGTLYNDACSPGGLCTGMGAASFLLGGVGSATASLYTGVAAERAGQYAGYFQDDFKATSKLTLNLGLRYDLMLPTVNAHNQRSWVDPFAVNPEIGIRGAVVFATDSRRAPVKAFTKAFGPRFGLAYSINEKTVFRGGYGIMYAGGGFNRTAGTQFLQGYNANYDEPARSVSGFVGLEPAFLLKDGWPSFKHTPPPFISPSYGLGTGPLAAFGDGRLPDIQNWHVSIQREVPGKMLIDVGYVGTKGTHLPSRLLPTTAVDTKFLSLGDALFKHISDPSIQALSVVQTMPVDPATGNRSPFKGFEKLWGGNALLAQALRPFPQYSKDTPNNGLAQMRDFGETSGLSTYHALQVQARKQLSHGLAFLTSYTWSKTLSDAESIFNEFSGFTQDFYNRKAEKSLSLLDFPHNLTVSYQYELPFGPGRKFVNGGGVAGKVLGGWIIAGLQQYTSGAPQGVVSANSLDPYFGPNGFLTRPNVNPGVPKRSQAFLNGTWDPSAPGEAGSVLNIAAWTNPQQANRYSFGNAPRTDGDIRRFPFYNEDISIIKRTSINERINVEFRADFLNIFNRTVFGFDQGGDQYGNAIQGTNVDFGTGSFGHVTSQSNFPREIQFGLKINY